MMRIFPVWPCTEAAMIPHFIWAQRYEIIWNIKPGQKEFLFWNYAPMEQKNTAQSAVHPGKNRANCSSARTATRSTTFWTAPETWPANASKAFRKDLDQKVNKRQKCLLYRCSEISKRGSVSDATSSGWIPPGGPRRRRQRTMWPPFVGGWGVFEVIEMKFDIPNVDCNFIVITVP